MLALKQQQLFDEIDTLPIDLKTKLVDRLLSSISPTDSSIDNLWIKELNNRKNEIDSGATDLVDGNEVFEKISKR